MDSWDDVLIMVLACEPAKTCSSLWTESTSNEAKVCQYEGADEQFIIKESYSSENSLQAEEKDLYQVCFQIGSHWVAFHEIIYLLESFWKYGEFQVWLKCDKNNGCFHKIRISCQIFHRIQQQDDNSCTEEHILRLINFFQKSRLCDVLWKYVVEPDGHSTENVIFMLDN